MVAPEVGNWTERSVAALVQDCLAGDERAWGELVDRYGRLVYSIPRRMGLSAADADDVFQNVFLLLYRNLSTLRDRGRVSSWLITTTNRECWRLVRHSGRYVDLDDHHADPAPLPEAEVTRLEREQAVRQGLRQLDDRCRELLAALFFDPAGPGYDLIAARLRMAVGSVGPTRARCFRKLETILLELGFDQAG
jgi:RNA polymerase sigma factor (sigma-70 family)